MPWLALLLCHDSSDDELTMLSVLFTARVVPSPVAGSLSESPLSFSKV